MGWDEIKKARRRLSREQGTILKDWGGKLPIAAIYPNSYFLGMSNLGLHVIYKLFNSYSDVVAERVFWEKENLDKKIAPVSLESQRPLSDFAVLAFSISYELDYFNVVSMLRSSGIPLYAAERDQRHPLIIAGGPCVMANPVPLAPFFDLFCIGEAEPIVPAILPLVAGGITGKRSELLKSLAELPGIYVPAYHSGKPVVRQWAKDLDKFPVGSTVLTPDTELGDLYLIEVVRGCNRGCRFCLTSQAFRPMRYRSVDSVIAQARDGLKLRQRLGLVGAAISDHPQIEELVVRLGERGAELSLSSLRMKPLSAVVLREVAKGGLKSVALAPEAGTERLRQVIKKGIFEADILEAVDIAAGQGIKQVKLYFMIGLPSETDSDIEAIASLILRSKAITDRRRGGFRIVVNVAPFVPKAGTPFQWVEMAPVATLNRRLAILKNGLVPKGIKLKAESPAWSEVQAVLARGDERISGVLADMEGLSLAGWRRAMEVRNLNIDTYVHTRWDPGKKLPWEIIDLGTKAEQLEKEMEKALAK